MTDISTLHQQIAQLFQDKLNLEVPAIDTDLIETGALDSLALVDLLVSLEQEFGMPIPLEEVEIDSFRTVASIAEFLYDKRELKKTA